MRPRASRTAANLPWPVVAADVGTAEGIRRVAEHVLQHGAPQALVHVAGGSSASAGGVAALTEDDWAHELDLNLLAAVRLDTPYCPR